MSTIKVMIYIVMNCLLIFSVSFLMEFYKKRIRKDRAKGWENKLLGFFLSCVCVGILVGINIFQPVLGLLGAPLWADITLYLIVFYILQLQVDMKVVKTLFRAFTVSLLQKAGLDKEQAEQVASVINSITNNIPPVEDK